MAIRFLCSNCQKPIEIDDEWASKSVACPFCRTTVSAPEATTWTETQHVPVASPAGALAPPTGEAASEGTGHTERPSSNRLAVVAFALSCCTLGMLAAHVVFQHMHAEEFAAFSEELQRLMAETSSITDAVMAYTRAHGNSMPSWLIVLNLLGMTMMASCAASLVCGLIAVRRPSGRRLALTSLALSGLVPIVVCCGGGA